ncbi:MAG: Glu/Leu/Phe/Val dehydrogenase [Actinomycetota bacterium]
MALFEQIYHDDYEQVVFNQDRSSGLKAIIAIHSTAIGPALGGTRFYPFESEEAALRDVLRLAKGMTYKSAAAGLDLGGGKAVIIGDPRRDKSEELFRAYGRFIEGLGGRYITAEDVGTAREDMDIVKRETRWVTGVSTVFGGSGDPSPVTAFGVFQGLRAVAMELWNTADLKGKRIAVQGVGKVGHSLVEHLVEAGASVIVADIDVDNLARTVSEFGVETTDLDHIYQVDCDVFSPCALGGGLNDETIPLLRCAAVAGAANNQLLGPEHGKLLDDAGILYAPDFIINAGGVINVADELRGYDPQRAMAQVERIFHTVRKVFQMAKLEKITPPEAANRLAEERIRSVRNIKRIQVRPPVSW